MPQHIVAEAPTKSNGTSLHRYWAKGIKKFHKDLNPGHTIAEQFFFMVLFSAQLR
jgi:hypothetical protein